MSSPNPNQFPIYRAEMGAGFEIAYVRHGQGGYPLVLLHGYPETKRIWWRNIGPLAEAGFEVIAPDLRGFGDSDIAPDGFYDPPAFATDVYRLVHDTLGHRSCATVGGDLGGVVAQDLGLRFPGFVEWQCQFNTIPPLLGDAYRQAGVPAPRDRSAQPTADYFMIQGAEAERLLSELDTPLRRLAYVSDFYGHRLWASPGTFTKEEVAFMAAPFADPVKPRASWGCYEVALGKRPISQPSRLFERIAIPTLVLYGPDDHVVPSTYPDQCSVAFTERIGPFLVKGAGHFLQWEKANVLNMALKHFLSGPVQKHRNGQPAHSD